MFMLMLGSVALVKAAIAAEKVLAEFHGVARLWAGAAATNDDDRLHAHTLKVTCTPSVWAEIKKVPLVAQGLHVQRALDKADKLIEELRRFS